MGGPSTRQLSKYCKAGQAEPKKCGKAHPKQSLVIENFCVSFVGYHKRCFFRGWPKTSHLAEKKAEYLEVCVFEEHLEVWVCMRVWCVCFDMRLSNTHASPPDGWPPWALGPLLLTYKPGLSKVGLRPTLAPHFSGILAYFAHGLPNVLTYKFDPKGWSPSLPFSRGLGQPPGGYTHGWQHRVKQFMIIHGCVL